jgi:dolichol-phosphate mannosyltransferase
MRAAMQVEPALEAGHGKPTPFWSNSVGALLIYAVLLRLVYLGLPELIHEEAYYWNYSRHLALSYLDHPPMVAWLIRGFTALLGHTVTGVRAGALFAWLVGAWFVFRLTRRVYGEAAALGALLLFAMLPVYFLAGLLMSPDMPMAACWAATLYFFYRALIDEEPSAWYGAGLFLGLGMLSKYTIALLGFAVLVFMLVDHRARRWFLRPYPWVAAGIALLLFSPVIVWNYQNEWMSFVFQGPRRAGGATDFSLPELLGTAALMITPVGLVAVAVATLSGRQLAPDWDAAPSERFTRGFRLLMMSTLLPFAVFACFSIFRHTKINWTGPIWLGALPFMAQMMTTGWPTAAGRWRAWLSPRTWRRTAVVVLLILGFAMQFLVLGVPGLSYPANKIGLPARGWPGLAVQIETILEETEKELGVRPLVVGLNSDRLSSWLAFYRSQAMARGGGRNTGAAALDTAGPNLFDLPRSHMYEVWFPSLEAYSDRPLILIGDKAEQLDVDTVGRLAGPVEELTAAENGQIVWRIYYRVLGAERSATKDQDD